MEARGRRPVSTEDRWIRGIEIRPSTVPGRKITHHALARLQQEETDPLALGAASDVGPGLLMEWAVGKQGEIMRPNSGKLIEPDRASSGTSTITRSAKRSPTPWSSACTSIRRARSRIPPGAGELQRDPGRQP